MSEDEGQIPAERLGYAEALAELEQILARLERDDVDVDVLAGDVSRAADLLKVCRDRLAATGVEVERLVADLTSED